MELTKFRLKIKLYLRIKLFTINILSFRIRKLFCYNKLVKKIADKKIMRVLSSIFLLLASTNVIAEMTMIAPIAIIC